MGKRILNRKDLRADFDAAERRKDDEEQDEDEEEDEEEEEGDEEEEAGEGEEAGEEEEAEDEAPPKKKKAKAPKAPAKPKSRARVAKVVRMRLVWGVFDNSNRCVATYEYPRKVEAEAHATRLTSDKRSTHFIQPVKEPIEEKKEKEK
jgi:cobalamin biosynthesis protein CobT